MAERKKRGYKWSQADGSVDLDGMKVDDFLESLNAFFEQHTQMGWVDLTFVDEAWGDYGSCLEVWGFRPLTEAEKEAAKKKRERERKTAQRQREAKEAAERKEYERLRLKFDPPATLAERTNVVDLDLGS